MRTGCYTWESSRAGGVLHARRILALVSLLALGLIEIKLAASDSSLSMKLRAIMDREDYQQAHWGLLAVDSGSGEIVYGHNPDKLFAPASVTKLYSAAAALEAFGRDYRFKTPVFARGQVDADGELEGDLVLVASGDLTMGGRADAHDRIEFRDNDHIYANGNDKAELTRGDPLAGLNELARQVAAAGVRRVHGDLLIDDRLFEKAEGTGSGPSQLTPIVINDNVIDITITPSLPGQPAKIEWRPQTAAVRVDARVTTVDAQHPVNITTTTLGSDSFVLRGEIPAGHKPLIRIEEVNDPSSFARSLFIEALTRAGVRMNASPLMINRRELLPAAQDYTTLRRVADLASPPFGEEIKLVLKVSHNLHASILPLLLAAKNGKRTLVDGLQLQRDFLSRAGVAAETVSFGGAAGGARSDYTTPRATVQLLRYMATRPDFQAYRSALPVLGMDGTLATAVDSNSPARGHVQAKTGTLVWENTMNQRFLLTSKALAGYMTTVGNREVAFAIFVNNVHLAKATDSIGVGRTLGRLCEILYSER
jgi:D-alanyl-D-alanine carboxypeptidase/D-alanyl-D-alanine-endopeptidase (penicillin-binding protein 4)